MIDINNKADTDYKITVHYFGKDYIVNTGSQAYILDQLLWLGYAEKHSEKELYELMYLIHDLYLKDDNSDTPLGMLVDYIYFHYEDEGFKDLSYREMLCKFYENKENFYDNY